MVHQMLPPVNKCPYCGKKPLLKVRLFKGARAECPCGVSGPYVQGTDWPEYNALLLWGQVAGYPERPAPPAPIMKATRKASPVMPSSSNE